MNRKCIIIINIFLLLLFSFTISIISSSAQNSVNPFSASPGRFVIIASGVSYKQGEAKYASISGFEHLISFSSVETFLEHASFSAENLHSSSELQNMDSPLSEGAYQWHTFYGSPNRDFGTEIAVDSAGGIVIIGDSDASWNGPGGQAPLHPHSGGEDIVVLKLDASGAYQWHTFYGSSSGEQVFGIAVDSAGGVVITGHSAASWDGPGGRTPLHPHSGGEDIVVLKLDASGSYQWHTFYGSSSGDYGEGIAVDGAGGIVITGFSDASWDGPGDQAPLHPHSGVLDIVVLKLDASGAY